MEPEKLNIPYSKLGLHVETKANLDELKLSLTVRKKQNAEERQIIEKVFVDKCQDTPILEDKARKIRINVLADHGLHFDELSKVLKEKSYDPSLMGTMQCSLATATKDALIESDKARKDMTDLIRSWLETTMNFAEGYYGGAYVSNVDPSLKGISEYPFVIKTNKDSLSFDEAIHEAFVLTQLNKLRKLTPNFEYLYGLAYINQMNELGSVGYDNSRLSLYTFLENAKGERLSHYLIYDKDFTFEKFVGVFLQVFCSLEIANKTMQFNHYDLHAGNIMLRKLDKPRQFTYEIDFGLAGKKKICVVSDYLVLMIDFGLSHIVYEGKHFGIDEGKRGYKGKYGSESYPFADVWRIIGLIYNRISGPLSDKVKEYILPYIVDDMTKVKRDTTKLPAAIPDLTKVGYDWFIKVLLKVSGALYLDQPVSPFVDVPHYSCESGECSTLEKYIDDYGTKELTLEEYIEKYKIGRYERKEIAIKEIEKMLIERLNYFNIEIPMIVGTETERMDIVVTLINRYYNLDYLARVVFKEIMELKDGKISQDAIIAYRRVFDSHIYFFSLFTKYNTNNKDPFIVMMDKERQKIDNYLNEIFNFYGYVYENSLY